MIKKKAKRSVKPRRSYDLRSDATVETGQHSIEKTFGLPRGCVRLLLPSKRPARSDKSIGALLTDWERKLQRN